jgi:hypothetical protein
MKTTTMSTVAVLLMIFLSFNASEARSSKAAKPFFIHCPGKTSASTDAEAMLAGAWRKIPRVFARVNIVQGRHKPVTRKNTAVQEVETLSPTNASPRASEFRKAGIRACGRRAAENSWAIVLLFGESPIAGTTGVGLVAKTPTGWDLWYAK